VDLLDRSSARFEKPSVLYIAIHDMFSNAPYHRMREAEAEVNYEKKNKTHPQRLVLRLHRIPLFSQVAITDMTPNKPYHLKR
jgi:hypothetical protein